MLEWSPEVKTLRTIGAAKAKTNFLSLVDEVQLKREPVLVTKNGHPVALLTPLPLQGDEDPLAIFKFGGGKITGDILAPANDPGDWEYD